MARPRFPEPYETYNIVIPVRLKAQLSKVAHDRRVSMASIIRGLIEKELKKPDVLELKGQTS